MPGEDTDNARLAAPPLEPWRPADVTSRALAAVAHRAAAATWRLGLRRWFWGEGVCLFGLVEAGLAFDDASPTEVVEWYDAHLTGGRDPLASLGHVNEVAPGAAAVVVAARSDRAAYVPSLLRMAQWTRGPAVTRDPGGAIEHWPGGVWADTMFMVGVFLTRLGVHVGDREMVRAGVEQLTAHAGVLQARNGFWVHGSHRGEVLPCHWGRANAWAALSMVDVVEQVTLSGLDVEVTAVRASLSRLLRALAAVQPPHGVWDVLVDGQIENRGVLETSAAAGLAAAMLRSGPVLGDDAIVRAGWRALRGVLPYVDDGGNLTRVSAGTVLQLLPFGYSVIRDDRPQPWGQGLVLTALAAAAQALGRGETPA